jgi:hypothetical protein
MRKAFAAFGIALAVAVGTAAIGAQGAEAEWVDLFDGTSVKNWKVVGDANWSVGRGVVQANKGVGFLVTPSSYKDFEMEVGIWTDAAANSGVFLRCQDPTKIGFETCYEVNIFDTRPDPTYGTGSIVNVAKVEPHKYVAAGKWNLLRISARGAKLAVNWNGTTIVNVEDSKFAQGPIALQAAAGVVKFRKVRIKSF